MVATYIFIIYMVIAAGAKFVIARVHGFPWPTGNGKASQYSVMKYELALFSLLLFEKGNGAGP